MRQRLQNAFCRFTGRVEHGHAGAVNHLQVWNHLAWLFGNELRHTN